MKNMFYGCSRLSSLDLSGFDIGNVTSMTQMFYGCYSLTETPKLSATTLADSCYIKMFGQCTSLTEAPKLPATTLATSCYESMFTECTSLVEAPDLMSKTLVNACYRDMFKGCSSLNYMKVGVMTLDNNFYATEEWVAGVNGPGVFIFPCGSTYDRHGKSEVPDNFTIISSPIIIFQDDDSTELWRDTIGCDVKAEYKGEPLTSKDGLIFAGWDPELSVHPEPGVYYYTAHYEDPSANNWLCFTAESDNASFFYISRGQYDPDVQYSTYF